MPRKSKAGTLASEDHVADHVRIERERRGWSTAELAARVTEAGCPINQSAVWRIENGNPRRKISVNELIAFSRVFQRPPDELLQPADETHEEISVIRGDIESWLDIYAELDVLRSTYNYYLGVLITDVWGNSDLISRLPDLLRLELAAHEAGFIEGVFERLYPEVAAALDDAVAKGSPPYAPSALEILKAAREQGKDQAWVRLRAEHWGRSADLEKILEQGKVWVPSVLDGALHEMPLEDFLEGANKGKAVSDPPVPSDHPARWTSDKFKDEVEP